MNEGDRPALIVEDLQTYFFTKAGVVKAVDGVSFSVDRGTVMGLVGESGCGKTVTGYSILGLVDPPGRIVGGRVLYRDEDLTQAPDARLRALRGAKISMIFQDSLTTLNPVLRIEVQMVEAIQAHDSKVSRQEALHRSVAALHQVGISSPEQRIKAYPHQFSGGMRQRVAIAIAMINKPDLIIADEPTTALDVTIQAQILYEVQKLTREAGTALIWITHDLTVVAGLADRISVMYAGRVVEQGAVNDVINRPLHPYTRGLIDSVPSRNRRGSPLFQIPGMPPSLLHDLPGCSFQGRCLRADGACAQLPDMTEISPGHSVRCFHPHAEDKADAIDNLRSVTAGPFSEHQETRRTNTSAAETPLIAIDHVTKRFVKTLDLAAKLAQRLGSDAQEEVVQAVDNVSFAVMPGEVVGLVGESGCGKSTLGRIVAGILEPSSGRIFHRGRDLRNLRGPQARLAKLKVQMIYQDPYSSLNPRMRLRDIVGEAPLVHGIVDRGDLDDHVGSVLARVGLDAEFKNRYPHQFSGGQRQRIGIARALAVNPEFIICDEAVAALDVSIQAQVLNLFMKLREDLNLTYLFISHDIGVVEHISDRIVVMYLGRVVETGVTGDILAKPNHPYTKALLREVPRLDQRNHRFQPVEGEIPSPLDPPSGCHFHPRCPFVESRCREEIPQLREVAFGRLSACHLNDKT